MVISYLYPVYAQSFPNQPNPVIDLKMDKEPQQIAINPHTNTVHILHPDSKSISLINGTTDKISGKISLYGIEGYPNGIAINPKTNKIYLSQPPLIVEVDSNGKNFLPFMKYIADDNSLAINPETNTIYTRQFQHVSVIDIKTKKIVANIDLDETKFRKKKGMPVNYGADRYAYLNTIAVNPKTNMIYVANPDSNSVFVINGTTNKITEQVNVGIGPTGLTVNHQTNKIYVTFFDSPKLGVIDGLNNNVNFLFNNKYIGSMQVDVLSQANMIYVANPDSNSVFVINGTTNKITEQVNVGSFPQFLAANQETKKIYTTNTGSDSVSIIYADKILDIPNNITNKAGINLNINQTSQMKKYLQPLPIAVNPKTNIIFAANSYDNSISVIDGNKDLLLTKIPLEERPRAIAIDPDVNVIYVGTESSDSISVIDGETNKVSSNIRLNESYPNYGFGDILVNPKSNSIYAAYSHYLLMINGTENKVYNLAYIPYYNIDNIAINYNTNEIYLTSYERLYVLDINTNRIEHSLSLANSERSSQALSINPMTNAIYIANRDQDTVSVVDATSNSLIQEIPVGNRPESVVVNPQTNTVYVANFGSGSISVIDGETNKVSSNIRLIGYPSAFEINPFTDTMYVSNPGLDSIIPIDLESNKPMLSGKTIFNVSPPNSGSINCNNEEMITNLELRLPFNSLCKAEPSHGFSFSGWLENIGENSTIKIKSVSDSQPLLNAILSLFKIQSDSETTDMTMTKSGRFTAIFKENSNPIPSEYWIGLYTVVISTIIGWTIPSLIRWGKSKSDSKKFDQYHKKILLLYDDGKLDLNDIGLLNKLKINARDDYTKGRINETHYINLNKDISMLYEEIFKKEIESLNLHDDKFDNKLKEIEREISEAYSKDKINELHYNLLRDKIFKYQTRNL